MPSIRVQSRKTPLCGSSATNLDLTQELVATSTTDKRRKGSTRQKPVVHDVEIIEISDSEPSTPATEKPGRSDLRRQLTVMQEEIDRYKADASRSHCELAAIRDELAKFKTSEPSKGKLMLDLSELEDNLNCGICTIRLWSPYILSGCGHTFCQGCLQDWFSTTLAQFMQSHPAYVPGTRLDNHGLWEAMMRNPRDHNNPYYPAYVARNQAENQQPHYTCPTCRETVSTAPTEEFALKELIRAVIGAAGEISPKRLGPSKVGRSALSKGPWEGFFPSVR